MAFGLKNTTALVERRRSQRESVDVAVMARTLTGDRIPMTVEVLSERGFLAATPRLFGKGAALDITFPTGRAVRVRVVWVENGKIGCQLAAPVDLRDLLKSADEQRVAPPERLGLNAVPRESYFGRAGERQVEPNDHGGEHEAGVPDVADATTADVIASADRSPPASDGAAWLESFGWLPVRAYEKMIDAEDGYLRPVLVRCGSRWALAHLSERGWVDMNESRLGEALDFQPTLWTPVSDDLAIDLADRR